MKLSAKVSLDEKSAGALVRAFFKEFHPDIIIHLVGKEAEVEIFFDKSSLQEIVEAICHCKMDELHRDKKLEDYDQEEENPQEKVLANIAPTPQKIEEEPPQEEVLTNVAPIPRKIEEESLKEEALTNVVAIPQENEAETPKAEEESANEELEPTKKRTRGRKAVWMEDVKIPELEDLAKKATSFEHFAELIADWLGMNHRKKYFVNLVIASAEIPQLSWKRIEVAMNKRKMTHSETSKNMLGRYVAKKFKDTPVRTLAFLNAIKMYKYYPFAQEPSNQDEHDLAEPQESDGEVEKEPIAEAPAQGNPEEAEPKSKVKMQCMPEIPELEEALASIDKTKPIEDRVMHVLTVMGIDNLEEVKKQKVFDIANIAVRLKSITYEDIMAKANIPKDRCLAEMLNFARFINDFAKKASSPKKVKVTVFLKELQEIIISEGEIEDI